MLLIVLEDALYNVGVGFITLFNLLTTTYIPLHAPSTPTRPTVLFFIKKCSQKHVCFDRRVDLLTFLVSFLGGIGGGIEISGLG